MCFRAAGVRIRGLGCRVLGVQTVGLFMRVDRISIENCIASSGLLLRNLNNDTIPVINNNSWAFLNITS